ncbi:MAG: fibronectin type III domain-containing protein [Sphingobacteriales bacterium]|nr:MAG: fibronectin type III domain-containing protein [Sphingobacteriales bacterium]
MKRIRTVKNFKNTSDEDLLAKGRKVHLDLSGNTDFLTPVPALPVLETALDNYEIAISNAANGGRHLVATRNEKRAVVVDILQRLGTYVDLNSPDIASIILGSGFDIYTTEHEVAPASEKPTIEYAKDAAHSGAVKVKSSKMKHAIANQLRYTSDPFGPEARWTELPSQTKTTFLLNGLTPGVIYWFQTLTISTKGRSDWSDPFQFMVR